MSDPVNDQLTSLSDSALTPREEDADAETRAELRAHLSHATPEEGEGEWLNVPEAAGQIGISERAVRRLIAQSENAALTRQETRRTRTGTRQATLLAPELIERLAREHGANTARSVDKPGDTPALSGDTEAEPDGTLAGEAAQGGGQMVVPADEFEALKNEVAQLRGALVGGALQKIDARLQKLDDLPDADTMRAAVNEAVGQAIANAVNESNAASSDDVATLTGAVRTLAAKIETMEAERKASQQAKQDVQRGGGFFSRLFKG